MQAYLRFSKKGSFLGCIEEMEDIVCSLKKPEPVQLIIPTQITATSSLDPRGSIGVTPTYLKPVCRRADQATHLNLLELEAAFTRSGMSHHHQGRTMVIFPG